MIKVTYHLPSVATGRYHGVVQIDGEEVITFTKDNEEAVREGVGGFLHGLMVGQGWHLPDNLADLMKEVEFDG